MKGDFSKWGFNPADNNTGVLHQQGRVLLDSDWNAESQIESHWRETLGQDAIGDRVLAVPAAEYQSFQAAEAKVVDNEVLITLKTGRGWADGVHLYSPQPADALPATYLPVPLNPAGTSPASIIQGVRDALVLEVWEEAVSGFQEPKELLEPALGGVDTTERSRACMALRLLRLESDEDCDAVVARAQDDLSQMGRLTVTPQPALVISGDCPLETGGGYNGLEHFLYRIEIGEPKAGQARFKWSQFNGGLVGTGRQVAPNQVRINANNQAINHCGLTSFYLEALKKNALGCWQPVFGAAATLSQDDVLSLTPDYGTWPGSGPADSVFFRLWNSIALVSDFPAGPADPKELKDGIRLAFDAPAANLSNYRPGNYWTFPVRAAGVALDTSLWPSTAPPQGVFIHRVPLAILEWQGDQTASYEKGQIDDCRHVFRPLSQQGVCCTYLVGDGKTSHGDFDSIQQAVDALPPGGGKVCLLPGIHEGGVTINTCFNITVRGCGLRTKVIPSSTRPDDPLFLITDSTEIGLVAIDMAHLGGTAVQVVGSEEGSVRRIEVRENRILAGTVGVHVENGRFVNIHHNRIRMVDRAGAGVAIYLQADDSRVERNELTVVPSLQMPPLDIPGGGQLDPTHPCAPFVTFYLFRRIFGTYVNLVWGAVLSLVNATPYQALSGIQLAAGAERVLVRDNRIHGGAGNGVSLGGQFEAPQGEPPDTQKYYLDIALNVVRGQVVPPEGKTSQGIQLGFTHTATGQHIQTVTDDQGRFTIQGPAGTYEIAVISTGYALDKVDAVQPVHSPYGGFISYVITLEEVPTLPDRSAAFLYDIRIEDNEITGMGLCGIGLAPQPVTTTGTGERPSLAASLIRNFLARIGNPVVKLLISRNRIRNCLLNPFTDELLELAAQRGLGGISLGMCEDTSILNNLVEDNGTSHLHPVCGIYVFFGEEILIAGNRVTNNGPFAVAAADEKMKTGIRGGIVIGIASAISLAGVFVGGAKAITASKRPAARLHANVVDQPAGQALTLAAFGPVACTDNSFSSGLSGIRLLDLLFGTVLIFNLGGVQNLGGSSKIPSSDATTPAGIPPTTAPLQGRRLASFTRTPRALEVLPEGDTQFNDNKVHTGALNTSVTCQAIISMDDITYQANQCYSDRSGFLFANAMVVGLSQRANGNRFSEAGLVSLMSLYSLAFRMNNTAFNQGDHCIVVTGPDLGLPETQAGNQVLFASDWCPTIKAFSDSLFGRLLRIQG